MSKINYLSCCFMLFTCADHVVFQDGILGRQSIYFDRSNQEEYNALNAIFREKGSAFKTIKSGDDFKFDPISGQFQVYRSDNLIASLRFNEIKILNLDGDIPSAISEINTYLTSKERRKELISRRFFPYS